MIRDEPVPSAENILRDLFVDIGTVRPDDNANPENLDHLNFVQTLVPTLIWLDLLHDVKSFRGGGIRRNSIDRQYTGGGICEGGSDSTQIAAPRICRVIDQFSRSQPFDRAPGLETADRDGGMIAGRAKASQTPFHPVWFSARSTVLPSSGYTRSPGALWSRDLYFNYAVGLDATRKSNLAVLPWKSGL
jgi:hypothetical protein